MFDDYYRMNSKQKQTDNHFDNFIRQVDLNLLEKWLKLSVYSLINNTILKSQ